MTTGLLNSVTVLDLSSVGPASRASRWLADFGADVVKVAPLAEQGLQLTPPEHAYSAHRYMRRIQIDLKNEHGRRTFLRLAGTADVILESFRPGVVSRLGIGYSAVVARNPRAIYCSTTGFGQDGPRALWAGHDLNYLAVSGFLDCSGRGVDGKPPLPGATVADSAGGGMHAVMAILAALVARSRTGHGRHLDVSVADGMLGIMALSADEFLATGDAPGAGSGLLTGRYACYDTYRTRDDRWLSVAAIENRFWSNLCRLVGLDKWSSHQLDPTVQDEIRSDLAAVFETRDRDEWVDVLSAADTCVAPVLTVAEATADEQFRSRHMFTQVQRGADRFEQVAPAFAGMVRTDVVTARPSAETDTNDILLKAGFSHDEILELRECQAVA